MFFKLQLFIPAKLAKFDKVLIIFVHKKYVSGTQEANRYKLNLKKIEVIVIGTVVFIIKITSIPIITHPVQK